MKSTILAAIDISHPKANVGVLRQAQNLAKMEGAQLAVVTVLPDYGSGFVGSFFPETQSNDMVEQAQKALHSFVRETLGDDSDVKHIIMTGTAYQEVLKAAQKMNASMIVIGAHKPNVSDFLIGPNAARIARHAGCSVHICR